MELTDDQKRSITGLARNGLIDITRRWPNKEVIYELDEGFSIDEVVEIEKAMITIESSSCIKFKERMNDEAGFIDFVVNII